MTESDHTFVLSPGGKSRYNAGPYDQSTGLPRHTIDVLTPDDFVKSQVEISQFLMGPEGDRSWVWDIRNKSTWPVFVIIKKDGVLVRR
jgi:hypothetical protein